MKKALLGAALLIAPFFSFANIFDNASNPVPMPESRQCMYNGIDITLYANQAYSEWKSSKGQSIGGVSSEDVEMRHNYNGPGQCKYKFYKSHYNRIQKSTGEWIEDGRYQSFNFNQTGPYETTYACDPTSEHSITGTRTGDSHSVCFTPQSLADVDTCDVNSPWLPVGSSTDTFQCKTKPDGSRCRYEMKQSNGQSWLQPTAEPDNCFTGNGSLYEEPDPAPTPPTGDECQEIGNGITACPENPANVCDSNGLCQTGCGTVAFAGEEHFMCLSSDTDGDGLGDYADPDIDGDGIHNDDDIDADGDGREDPVYPVGQNSNNVQHQSNVETLLAQIAQNTNGSSNNGSNPSGPVPTAEEIGESVAEELGEELEEKLTELGDFSTTSFEQSVDSKVEDSNNAVNQFLESEDSDLTNAFDQSDFEGSYNNFKTALSPTGCTADISIPFTSSKLDLCTPASKAQPFLYVIFAIATFIYCVRRIQTTVRKD